MLRKMRYFFLFVPLVCLLAALFFLTGQDSPVKANLDENWLTIDAQELKQVEDAAQRAGKPLGLQVRRVENGIAIVKATENQIVQLTQHTHEEFRKCAGFMAHESETEALATIERFARAAANQPEIEYTINNAATVQPIINNVQASEIVSTINSLSSFNTRYYNSPDGLQSATWIKNRWTQLAQGRTDVTVEFFNHPTWQQPSVILTIPGTTLAGEVVVLGAHQDSIRSGCNATTTCLTLPAPGSDDDASGIASLTEVIRVALANGYRPQRTVKFMAYAGEETGLRGSNAIAADFLSRSVNVVGVLQLDMTNYKGSTTTDIAIFTDFTNASQNQFLGNLITTYLPTLTVANSQCGYACSDHAAWTNRGYAASFPHESPFNVSNPRIHTANDTLANSDPTGTHALKFSKLAAAYIGELAKGNLAQTTPSKKRADFDGDGKTDVSVFRPAAATWYLNRSNLGFTAQQFGASTDLLIPADYDGDGKTDIAVFRPSGQGDPTRSFFYITNSSNGAFVSSQFGSNGDVPASGDFDGDGKADVAVYRNGATTGAQSYFFYRPSGTAGVDFRAIAWGVAGDKAIRGDFDGDGKADAAVFRSSDGVWYIQSSQTGQMQAIQFGIATDKLVAADYDGDGKDDIAVYRDGNWFIRKSSGGFSAVQFGIASDVPVPGDYDGDGKTDVAVYRDGNWYVTKSSDGSFYGTGFGVSSDKPLPNSYLPQN